MKKIAARMKKKTKELITLRMKSITTFRLITCLNQRIPVNDFLNTKYNHIPEETLSVESQEAILPHINKIIPSNAYYIKLFLKQYINLIELYNEEVIETLYELYCDGKILGSIENKAEDAEIIEYWINDEQNENSIVKIKETPKLISGNGTTGLRTWEAALYLSHYLNQIDLTNKKICELGTGTGLVSLSIMKNHDIEQIILTDGDSNLIDNLNDTFKLNNLHLNDHLKTQQLLWGTTNLQNENFIQPCPKVDMVIAADVTYDSSILPQLCSTIFDFLNNGTKQVIIAATVRNQQTIDDWEDYLNQWFASNWQVADRVEDPHSLGLECWFKKGTPPINIYSICN